ncbi:AraC family transcriptional regulator [Chitinophaga barathri]|uniref:AraC family transcriptional regulator n=1 Tax=Chitinophaga barathri TaxID=1647451 RepID=A0A3N4M9D1_9BACT|nr:helix-turn-helix domain-containing protein [Chitinophaga barathri]RPD38226.1 AraC family transcriptional regulator [Chitinophaga barathri]
MKYQQLVPPSHLKDYIRHFWILESEHAHSDRTFRTIADGSPGLIIQDVDKGVMFKNDQELPDALLYGQTTSHAEVKVDGMFSTIGIYFSPSALRTVFGLRADELTNGCLPLDEIARSFSRQLAEAGSLEAKVKLLTGFVSNQVSRHEQRVDKSMEHALNRIWTSEGTVPLKELRDELAMSERSFERRFKQIVGVPPKMFLRISQFQASLTQLRNLKYEKLSDVAFGNEYADQSHFIRTFKEFAGVSPFKFSTHAPEVMENFSAVNK